MGLKESGLRGSLRNVSVGIDAIPDSVVYHPVVSEAALSEGDPISSIPDLVADDDWSAVGSPTYRADEINGEDVAELDGIDDGFVSDAAGSDFTFLHDGTDFAVLLVYEVDDATPSDFYAFMNTSDGTGSNLGYQHTLRDSEGGEHVRIGDGSSVIIGATDSSGLTTANSVHIQEFELDEETGTVRVDGDISDSDSGTGFSSSNPSSNAHLGCTDGDSDFLSGEFAEGMILKEPEDGDVVQARDYLASKYGISL